MALADYDDLVTAVGDWLGDRSDLATRIPDFIRLAEANIYRELEMSEIETTQEYDRTAESPLTDVFAVPADYREAITFERDDEPMTRISRVDQLWKTKSTRTGPPEHWARQGANFQVVPFPDDGYIYTLTYFQKLAGLTTGQTNDVFDAEPGLFLYGALVEAEPFVRSEAPELVAIWKGQYEELLDSVRTEFRHEQVSGSDVEVQGAFGPLKRFRVRTGWA